MVIQRLAILSVLITFFSYASLYTQVNDDHDGLSLLRKEATLQGNGTRGPYSLPDYFILAETERVEVSGTFLTRGLEYVIDYDSGEITFQEEITAGTCINVMYKRLPISLKRSYLHRKMVRQEAAPRRSHIVKEMPPEKRIDLPDMSGLRIGGSKSLGISLGSDRDLSLEQSLRVNITGQIAKNVEVVALLSDQSSPLQPEGTTQTLEELDKVSIELRGKHVRAAFGDYTLSHQKTVFGRLDRKLQGALGELNLSSSQVAVSGASSKGTFTTNRFMGLEGNQGPYQLQAEDGSINIIVLAGTERVWIDGEFMTRGQNNDYTIEYANGQITFTRHRLITSESRIVIDFEYIDEEYRRSLYTGRGSLSLGGEKLRMGVTFFNEADDKNDPLGVILSDTDRVIISAAGDDPDNAFRYTDDGSTKVFLPLPRSHSLADLDLNFSSGTVELSGEMGLSRYDANTFSNLDDSDNIGEAYIVTGALKPLLMRLGRRPLGNIELSGFYRRCGEHFQPVGRTVSAEYNRRWNLSSDLNPETEEVSELNAIYRPYRESAFSFGWGRIERGTAFKGSRKEIRSDFVVKDLPQIHYMFESIESRNGNDPDSIGLVESDWTRHHFRSEYTFWKFKPKINVEGERKEDIQFGRVSDGFKFYDIETGLSTLSLKTVGIHTGFGLRKDWEFEGRWLETSESKTFKQGFTLKEWRSLSISSEYTRRIKHYVETSGSDRTTDLADFKINYAPFNRAVRSAIRYQISSLQAAKKERQYIDIGEWKGNYRFDELTDEYIYDPGKQESRFLLRTVTVGDFEPIIELKANLNLKIQPDIYFAQKQGDKSKLARWLSMLETETVLKIEEKSKEKDKWAIYLFDMTKFQQDRTTVDGRITFRQDLFLLPRRQKLNIRLRFERSDGENNQLVEQGSSQTFGEERLRTAESVRIRSKIATFFDFQGEFKKERNMRKLHNRTTYDIRSKVFSTDIGYRPRPAMELSFESTIDLDTDRQSNQRSLALTLSPGVSYSILLKGRARTNIAWTHVSVESEDLPLYYTMAGGRKLGNNIDWSFTLDYRLQKYVTALFSYTGRSEPNRPAIHSGRAEMRAFF